MWSFYFAHAVSTTVVIINIIYIHIHIGYCCEKFLLICDLPGFMVSYQQEGLIISAKRTVSRCLATTTHIWIWPKFEYSSL